MSWEGRKKRGRGRGGRDAEKNVGVFGILELSLLNLRTTKSIENEKNICSHVQRNRKTCNSLIKTISLPKKNSQWNITGRSKKEAPARILCWTWQTWKEKKGCEKKVRRKLNFYKWFLECERYFIPLLVCL